MELRNEQAMSILEFEQLNGLVAAAGAEGVREIINAFWRSTDSLIEALAEQIAQANPEEAARTAHAIKGSAANVGATSIASAARAVEMAARAGTPGDLVDATEDLRRATDETRGAFDDFFAKVA